MDSCPVSDLFDDVLQRMGLNLLMRTFCAYPQGRIIVIPCVEIFPKGNLGFIIEPDEPVFSSLSVTDVNRVLLPVDIRQKNIGAFADTASRAKHEINQCFFPWMDAVQTEVFQAESGQCVPVLWDVFDFLNVHAWIALNVSVYRHPLEESIQRDTDSFHVAIGRIPLKFEFAKV